MRYLLLCILILSFFSCGGSQHITHEVVKPDGSPYPDPYYVLQTVDPNKPIRVSFFYSSIKMFEDLDGKQVPQQKFLDRKTNHYFLNEGDESVQLVARVLNPKNMRYKVYIKQSIEFSEGGTMDSYALVAYSDMKYREFIRSLPMQEGIKEVTYLLEVRDEAENLLVPTGKFHYYIRTINEGGW